MVTLRFDTETMARTRLSSSPAMEALAWLKLAAGSSRHPVFGDPGPAARAALAHPDVALLLGLLPPRGATYTPDLLTPQPGADPDLLDAQLAQVESTPQDELERQVFDYTEIHWGHAPSGRLRRLADAGTLQRRLASGMERFWRTALATDWTTLHTVLERDIADKAALMGRHGVGRLLESLHPEVTRCGDGLVLERRWTGEIDIRGRDLVLAPIALSRPEFLIQVDVPGQAVLYYPATGVGTVQPRRAGELGRVVGEVRAALLTDLGTARSTADLATRHGYTPATISYHLHALHRAKLVTKHRDGRFVLYTRTEHATTLLGRC